MNNEEIKEKGGRPPLSPTPEFVKQLRASGLSVQEIAQVSGLSRSAVYGRLRNETPYERRIELHGRCSAPVCTRPAKANSSECHHHQLRLICGAPNCWRPKFDDWSVCRGHFRDQLMSQLEPFDNDLQWASVYFDIPWTSRCVTSDGYVTLQFYSLSVRENRVVMGRNLGRRLTAEEDVHHKNGNRSDNRIKNLELKPRYHGRGQSVEDLLEFAYEIIATHGSEAA